MADKEKSKQRKSRAVAGKIANAAPGAKPSRKGTKTQSVGSPRASKGMTTHKSLPEFSPTLGDVDLHLFNEGRHERIYEKLGARLTTHEGKRGVAFAVWAPSADHVGVAGNLHGCGGP